MNTLSIDGWCKPSDSGKSVPIGMFHFTVDDASHLKMERAEEQLQESQEKEIYLDVDMNIIELVTPDGCGNLSDCRLRVYLNPEDNRGHFHLVGHRASDGELVYTNAVMVDQLG
ncbi:hypothetical protein [Neptunomonas qingdaonensis]|uniref:Uncharacterized protein n=1 Tax=Neptunomonas qingdaonensis TaxID=1045558 RepID=A0A1I2T421_9GAMM|nr:hypothetical protein [Neptunomonas qingdaonensis]SFG59560.1 hypothetical protein SAMN05216175_10972 [Neptunomonas qingdaonensis]